MAVTQSSSSAAPARPPAGLSGLRRFGRFVLRQLLGRSTLTMAWQAHDTRSRQEVLLMLPRHAAADTQALQRVLDAMRRAARVSHPRLLPVLEQGQHELWPYLVCERPPGALTLSEWFAGGHQQAPLLESAGWCVDALQGLACVHDGGLAHGDIGLHSLILDRNGHVLLWGAGLVETLPDTPTVTPEADTLRQQREAGERDLRAMGLLLYRLVSQSPALDEPDLPTAVTRLSQDIVRLPWALPQPVPEALRAIVNRSVDRHAHRRYLGARSLERALSGWVQVQASDRGGPLALLVDRLRSVGHLPARPGLAQRLSQVARMEAQRLDDLADVILQDPALSFELLRSVNSAQFGRASDDGVTTVRRAIQLIGISGVRNAAAALRSWPGPLSEAAAPVLDRLIKRACLAGHMAEFLAPAGLDAEGSLLAAQLQHLGRLLVAYHFPDEAAQINTLMLPVPAVEAGERPTPGLSEDAAAMAVLGVDLSSLAHAVARHWGLDESVQDMMQPLPLEQTVRAPLAAGGWMRLVASCANEALGAFSQQPAAAQARALALVAGRYAKTLGTSPENLKEVLALARAKLEKHLVLRTS